MRDILYKCRALVAKLIVTVQKVKNGRKSQRTGHGRTAYHKGGMAFDSIAVILSVETIIEEG